MSDKKGSELGPTTTHMDVTKHGDPSIEQIVMSAVERGTGAEELGRLLEVYERMQENKARTAFQRAFQAFQVECPAVPRNAEGRTTLSTGGSYSYRYADTDEIRKVADPVLHKHGLCVAFDDMKVEGNMVTETCVVSHVDGHRQSASFTCPSDSRAGMSPQQKYGGASTYAQRRAICKVLGLQTGEPDLDGNEGAEIATLTDDEVQDIRALLESCPKGSAEAMLNWAKVATIEAMPQSMFRQAVRALEKKSAKTRGAQS